MAENINNINPTGEDSIKGGIFFGSNLTPGGTFSNIPTTTSTPPPTAEVEAKIILTLGQIQEELRRNAQTQLNTEDNVLSDQAVNTFLQNYVKLLIDYSDMRNFVFFGSAYTELVYHVNFLIKNYPYLGYLAKDVGSLAVNPLNTITLTPLPGNITKVSFEAGDLLQTGQYTYDNSGQTIWTDFELVDTNQTRFPVTQVGFTVPTIGIIAATNSSPIVIQTASAHGLSGEETVTITNVTGNTAANGIWKIATVSIPASPTALSITQEYKVLSTSASSNSITYYRGQVFTATVTDLTYGTVVLANEFALVNSVGNGAYTGGGTSTLPYLQINDASATNPIVITTVPVHGLQNGDVVNINYVTGNTAANGKWVVDNVTVNTFELVDSTFNGVYLGNGNIQLNYIDYYAQGNITINNLIEYVPTPGVLYRGLFVSPKLENINDFTVNLDPVQTELLSPTNTTPWPRDPVTNNILFEGSSFDLWTSNPTNMVSNYVAEDLGIISTDFPMGLNLTGAITLDETQTNQLIRRGLPHRVIDELRDTDDKLFSRFVLLAGKMFDTIKVYIDFLKYTKSLNYGKFNQLSPEFYKLYAEHYGFNLFDDDAVDLAKAVIKTEPGLSYDGQFNAEFTDLNTSQTQQNLQFEKQKRLLLNLLFLYQTKGTHKCIEKLVALLGAPDGLVLFYEYAFDTVTGNKIVDNDKVKVPKIAYEIDPDFLKNPDNINDPINQPYVYRLKLDNESITNLREMDMYTDPQGAIQQQILNYGSIIYPYGHFGPKSFANLQNHNTTNADGYYLLPLTFPDKYCGITVEYMMPRNAYTKGVGQGFDETTIHLGSLYEVSDIVYDSDNAPVPIPAATQFVPLTPQIFMEGLTPNPSSDPLVIKATAEFKITNLGSPADLLEVLINTFPIGGVLWQSTKKLTALALVNDINFTQTSPDFIAFYTENEDGTFTITIKTKSNDSTPDGSLVEVLSGGIPASGLVDNDTPPMSNDIMTTGNRQFIIARAEGKDLVVRARLTAETGLIHPITSDSIAKFDNLFAADGLNHTLRLIYRPEGIEVYQDFKYLGLARWRNPATNSHGVFNALDCPHSEIEFCSEVSLGRIFAYPDNDPNVIGTGINGFGQLTINNANGVINNIEVFVGGASIMAPISPVITTTAALAADIANAINLAGLYTAVAITNIITITQVTLDILGNGDEITVEYDNLTGANIFDFVSYAIEGADTIAPITPGDPFIQNPFVDAPKWWDLIVGLPVNIDMFFKRVSVFEAPSINHPDPIDFGIDPTGFEVEKFSFAFTNQIKDSLTSEYITTEFYVPCEFRAQFPYPPGATVDTDNLDVFFSAYPTSLVSDIVLVNQTYENGDVFFTQDIQNFFDLPNGERITIDSLFTFNGWSPSIHKDYYYTNYNNVFENYELFSTQVLTYLSLLSFMELIEDKFKQLISQFIPIVINIARIGRLIRSLDRKKVHYPNIHMECEGTLQGSVAAAELRITNGTNNAFASTNNNIGLEFALQSNIFDASNTPVITITTAEEHNLTSGQTVTISGVIGNPAANGTWIITVTGVDTFTIPTAGSGTFVPGTGLVEYVFITTTVIDWNFTNSNTATDVANDINTLLYPTIVASTNDNVVILSAEPTLFFTTYGYNVNDVVLKVLVNGNVRVDSVFGLTGGVESIGGDPCFTVEYVPAFVTANGDIDQLIYYNSESGPQSYIYYNSEGLEPIYIYYDSEETP